MPNNLNLKLDLDLSLKGRGARGSTALNPEQEQALLIEQAEQLGLTVKPKEGTLQKIARYLNKPRAFVGGIQQYGPTGGFRGMSEDLDSSKILEQQLGRPLTTEEKVKAFATDVALDPLTYLTIGTGTGVKIATQQGAKTLSKAGAKKLSGDIAKQMIRITEEEVAKNASKNVSQVASRSMLEKAAEDRARALMARKIDQGAKEYTQESMLRVGVPGVQSLSVGIMPTSTLKKPFSYANEKVAQAPVVGEGYQQAVDLMGRAFVKDYDVSKQITQLRKLGDPESLKKANELESFKSLKQSYLKGTAGQKEQALRQLIMQARSKDLTTRDEILKFMERPPMIGGAQADTDEIMSVHKTLHEIYRAGSKDIASMEKAVAKAQILENIPGIGKTKAAQLRAVGINSLDDLTKADSQQLVIAMDAKYKDIFNKAGYEATPDFIKAKIAYLKNRKSFYELNNPKATKELRDMTREIDTLEEALRGGLPGNKLVTKTADVPKLRGAYQKVEAGRKGMKGYESLMHQKELLVQSITNDVNNARAIRDALNGSLKHIKDPNVREGAQYLSRLNKSIARKEINAGVFRTEQELQNYVHRILTPEARKAIQASKGGMVGFPKELSTSLGSASKHRSNPLTILESEAAMKAKYGVNGDFYIKDPYLTTAVRQQTSIGAVNTKHFFDDIMAKFGKQAQSREYEVFGKQGTIKKSEFVPFVDEVGMEYVVPAIKEFQDASIAVPRVIAKDIEKTNQALSSIGELRGFVKIFDSAQSLWKSSVTGLFPAFHARNMIGGMFNNWLAGINTPAVYVRTEDLLRRVNKLEKAITPEARKAAEKALKQWKIKDSLGHTITGSDLINAYDMKLGRGSGRSADMVKDISREMATGPGAEVSRSLGYGKKTLEFTEERLRMPLFIDTWRKTGSFDDAAARVIQFHFDYTPAGMTQFENQVMKRLIPFYRWVRGNIPLQLEQMAKQPGKSAATLRAIQNFIDPSVKEELPSYLQENMAMQLGPVNNGVAPILTSLGLPIEDLNKLDSPRDLVGSISPLLRYPAEIVTGKSIFYDKPIDDMGGAFAKYYVDGPLANFNVNNWMEIQEVKQPDGTIKYVGNPRKLYAMQQAIGRFSTTIGKAKDENVPAWTRTLGFTTGAQIKNVDIDTERQWRIRDMNRRINKMLVEKGIKKEYTDYYTPKGVTVSPIRPTINLGRPARMQDEGVR